MAGSKCKHHVLRGKVYVADLCVVNISVQDIVFTKMIVWKTRVAVWLYRLCLILYTEILNFVANPASIWEEKAKQHVITFICISRMAGKHPETCLVNGDAGSNLALNPALLTLKR
jgi:hypothetical protein